MEQVTKILFTSVIKYKRQTALQLPGMYSDEALQMVRAEASASNIQSNNKIRPSTHLVKAIA